MQMIRSKNVVITLAILIVIISCLIVGSHAYRVLDTLVTFDAKTDALEKTNQLLFDIQNSLETPTWRFGNYGCWIFLRNALKDQGNEYDLQVAYYNWDDPNYNWRDVDEVYIDVNFSEDKWARVLYYEGGFNGCFGYHEELTRSEIDAIFSQTIQAELPEQATNIWGTEIYISGIGSYIRFSIPEEELSTFLEESIYLSNDLEKDLIFDEIIEPYHFENMNWMPKNLRQVSGLSSEWQKDENVTSNSMIMVGKGESDDLLDVYLRISSYYESEQ